MSRVVEIPGVDSGRVAVKVSAWSSPKLLLDNKPAPRGPKPGQFSLPCTDGTNVTAKLKFGLDLYPLVIVDGQTIRTVPALKWFEWLLAAVPLVLLAGGFIGGVFGAAAYFVNLVMLRTDLGPPAKYALCLVNAVVAFYLYLLLALLVSLWMHWL